ncbi:MAG: response regulator [Candidatus Omnitrophica bacterium]|nr:response regulator [Candidatus Omnitrophota bacterium]
MITGKPRILIIDDEDVIRQLVKRTLSAKGYLVDDTENGIHAIEKIKRMFYHLVITDLKMPRVNGMDVLQEIKRINPYIEVIIVSGYATIESAVEAIKVGAFDFICKPFDIDELEVIVARCLEKQKASLNNIELNELNTLFEVSRITTAHTSLDALLRMVLDSALKLTGARRGYLVLFEESGEDIGTMVTQGMDAHEVHRELPHPEKENKPCAPPHSAIPEHLFECFPTISASLERRELYGSPVTVGVLSVSDKIGEGAFSRREKTLLGVVAGQSAAAIENHRLYAQVRDKVHALEKTIRKLHETQDYLIQSEKLSAVGQLAFGIAHEIRNPLGIVLGGVDFMRSRLKPDENDVSDSIDKMKRAIERANAIILSLLKFSRSAQLKVQRLDLNEVLNEVLGLIRNPACVNRVKIICDIEEGEHMVMADPVLLKQAVFNLCINAFEAMPRGGQLRLGLRVEQQNVSGDGSLVIEVTDTGEGMPEKTLSRIFEPFFTTKEPGKGTGLGLSIVHLIVQRHNGTIKAESSRKRGTRFIIRVPSAASGATGLGDTGGPA